MSEIEFGNPIHVDYEKKYKETLERAKYCLTTDMDNSGHWAVKHIFPELKVSEAWLEKQDEKPQGKSVLEAVNEEKVYNQNCVKLTDKIKSKFKVGDWITNGNAIYHISNIRDDGFYCFDYGPSSDMILYIDNICHLWTIDDATDGDVLSYVTDEDDLWIMIYWSLYEPYEGHVHYHALLVNNDFSDKGTCCICIDNLKPATKEQCDLLFSKMKDAGYEYNEDKKELKKIHVIDEGKAKSEQKLVNSTKTCKDEDTLLSLLQQMPSCITVDGIDYHFVLKKTIAYMIFYESEVEGNRKVIFWMAGELVDICKRMLKRLENERLI